jgi:hypothetical protein
VEEVKAFAVLERDRWVDDVSNVELGREAPVSRRADSGRFSALAAILRINILSRAQIIFEVQLTERSVQQHTTVKQRASHAMNPLP